jgi:hypothetical protein
MFFLPGRRLFHPCFNRSRFGERQEFFEHEGGVAHDRDFHRHVAGNGGGIDIDVHDPGVRGEGIEFARDPVVKTRADTEEEVAFGDRHVGGIGAVHPDHAQVERMIAFQSSEPHQGTDDGNAGFLHEAAEHSRSLRDMNPAANEEQRLGRFFQEFGGALDLAGVAFAYGVIAAQNDFIGIFVIELSDDDVLGNVNDHRTGSAGAGNDKRLFDGRGQFAAFGHQVVVLGDGAGDADGVRFLKGVVADHVERHLSGNADDGRRIEIGRGQAGGGVGRAGAARHQTDADLAGGARITVGGMHGGLLVAGEDDMDGRFGIQRVENGDHDTAGKTEDHGDFFPLQGLDQHGRAAFHHFVLLAVIQKVKKRPFPRKRTAVKLIA